MLKYLVVSLLLMNSILMYSQDKNAITAETVDFILIENPPIFPGCEKLDKKLQKMCLQNQIQKHVSTNFNTSLANTLDLKPGKTRLYVIFEIAADGTIKNVKARGEHEMLEEEGIRVINSLPIMTPGYHEDKPVGVKYTIPITIMVDKQDKKVKQN